MKVPGIGFAEWGPGDMSLSLGIRGSYHMVLKDPRMVSGSSESVCSVQSKQDFFLNSMNPDNVIAMIDEGVMIGSASQETAEIGRKYTKREMP